MFCANKKNIKPTIQKTRTQNNNNNSNNNNRTLERNVLGNNARTHARTYRESNLLRCATKKTIGAFFACKYYLVVVVKKNMIDPWRLFFHYSLFLPVLSFYFLHWCNFDFSHALPTLCLMNTRFFLLAAFFCLLWLDRPGKKKKTVGPRSHNLLRLERRRSCPMIWHYYSRNNDGVVGGGGWSVWLAERGACAAWLTEETKISNSSLLTRSGVCRKLKHQCSRFIPPIVGGLLLVQQAIFAPVAIANTCSTTRRTCCFATCWRAHGSSPLVPILR